MLVSASKDSTVKVSVGEVLYWLGMIDWPQIWDLKTYKIKVDLPGHTDEVYCVDYVADKLVSGGRDATVKM
jgi:ribosome assembly protein 4